MAFKDKKQYTKDDENQPESKVSSVKNEVKTPIDKSILKDKMAAKKDSVTNNTPGKPQKQEITDVKKAKQDALNMLGNAASDYDTEDVNSYKALEKAGELYRNKKKEITEVEAKQNYNTIVEKTSNQDRNLAIGYTLSNGQRATEDEMNGYINDINTRNNGIYSKANEYGEMYKNGTISYEEYNAKIQGLKSDLKQLNDEANGLKGASYGYYDYQTEYNNNYNRVNEIKNELTDLYKQVNNGAISPEDFTQLNLQLTQEKNTLLEQNKQLKPLIEYQDDLKSIDQYDYSMSGYATDKEKDIINQKLASYDDGFWERRLNYVSSIPTSIVGGAVATYDLAKDYILDKYGKSIQDSEKQNLEAGVIDLKTYNQTIDIAQKYIDFSANGENNWSTQIKDITNRIRENVQFGSENDGVILQTIGEALDQTAQFMSEAVLAQGIGNGLGLGASAVENISLLTMAMESGSDVAHVDLQNGESIETALLHGTLRGTLSYLTEKMHTDQLLAAMSGELGNIVVGKGIEHIAREMVRNGTEEGIEEIVEWFFSPLVDSLSYNATGVDYTLSASDWNINEAMRSFVVAYLSANMSGAAGAVSQVYNYYNNIVDNMGAADLISLRRELQDILNNDNNLSFKEKNELKKWINVCTEALNNAKGELQGKVFIGDEVNQVYNNDYGNENNSLLTRLEYKITDTFSRTKASMAEAISPDVKAQVKEYSSYIDAVSNIQKITQAMMENAGIHGNAREYLQMSPEKRAEFAQIAEDAANSNYEVWISSKFFKNGEVKSGYDGVIINGNKIIISPDADAGTVSTIVHEFVHTIEKTGAYDFIKSSVIADEYGTDTNSYFERINNIRDVYRNTVGQELSYEDAERELVAKLIQREDYLGNREFLDKLLKYDQNAVYRMFTDVMNKINPDNSVGRKMIEAFHEARAEMSTGGTDARYSMDMADKIKAEQLDMVKNGKSKVSIDEIIAAQDATTEIVNTIKSIAGWQDLLPPDKVGKVLLDDASYGKSVENSTICPRTLAYNQLTDYVSERVGRPLTQKESFLVSQMLYEVAIEPQCLYCYVALDRKSYNEMTLRYIKERDNAIKRFNEEGKPNPIETIKVNDLLSKKAKRELLSKQAAQAELDNPLFKEFLNGRKATPNMWSRYKTWIDYARNGTALITENDVTTEAKKNALKNGDGALKDQVTDMLAYAQSASWAKQSYEYRAYYNDIRKLSHATVSKLNKHYGLRWYSFNDFSSAYIVENMQQFTDAAMKGLKGLAYTKDCAFARIFAQTGCNINISVFANKRADGTFYIDPVQSADLEEAIELRNQYKNVGIVVTSTDYDGVKWALKQEWSDVVIPFHIVRTGQDVADFFSWSVFNSEQNDTVNDKEIWLRYVKSLAGDNENAQKKVSKMIYPSEHNNDFDTYIKLCNERGLKPRFASFMDGEVTPEQYMKLVNETRRSDSETTPLHALFDVDAAKEAFNAFADKGGFYGGWYKDGVDLGASADQVAQDIINGLTAKDTSYGTNNPFFDFEQYLKDARRMRGKLDFYAHKNGDTTKFSVSEKDKLYNKAIKYKDNETAQYLLNEKAKEWGTIEDENGNPLSLYHGTTAAGFTKFDLGISQNSIFLTTTPKNASSYSGTENVDNLNNYIEKNKKISAIENEAKNINDIDAANEWLLRNLKAEEGYGYKIRKNPHDPSGYQLYSVSDEGYIGVVGNYQDIGSALITAYNFIENDDSSFGHDKIANLGNYKVYAKADNLLTVDAQGELWDELPYSAVDKSGNEIELDANEEPMSTRSWCEYAQENGYDGVYFKNIVDYGGANIELMDEMEMEFGNYQKYATDIYAVFNSNQVKSADTVTYDNNGKVIPLSKRFNDKNEDIRYSVNDVKTTSNTSNVAIVSNKIGDNGIVTELSSDLYDNEELIKLTKNISKFTGGVEESGDQVAQIVSYEGDNKKQKKAKKKAECQKIGDIIKNKILDKGYAVDQLARTTNDPKLKWLYDYSMKTDYITSGWVNNKMTDIFTGKEIGEGLSDIFEDSKNVTDVLTLSKYLYNYLNIDRMSLESRFPQRINETLSQDSKQYKEFKKQYIEKNYNKVGKEATRIADGNKVNGRISNIQPNELDILKAFWKQEIGDTNKVNELVKQYNDFMSNSQFTPEGDPLEKFTWEQEVDNENFRKNKPVFGDSVTAEMSEKIVREMEAENPALKSLAERIWNRERLQRNMLVETGVLSKEQANYLEQLYPHYIPVSRIVNTEYDQNGNVVNANKALKTAKGGNQNLNDWTYAVAKHDRDIVKTVLNNELYKAIANHYIETPFDTDITFKNEDRDAKYEDMYEEYMDEHIAFDSITKKGKMMSYDEGIRTVTTIPEDVYNSLTPRNIVEFPVLYQLNDVRKKMITSWNPIFAATNAIKDIQDALVNTQNGARWVMNYPRAYFEMTTKSPAWKAYVAMGGQDSSYYADDIVDWKLNNKDNIAKKALEKVVGINDAIEAAPRFAEYLSALQRGKSSIQAMYEAAEITTNFKRGGDWAKNVDRNFVAFLNASIQGFMKQFHNFQDAYDNGGMLFKKGKEINTNDEGITTTSKKIYAGVLLYSMKMVLGSGLPLALLSKMIWGDDKDYEDLSDYIKDNYYIVGKTDGGNFIRVPKGRVLSFYQNVYNEGSDVIGGETKVLDALGDIITSFVDNVAPNNPIDNNLFSPLVQAKTNKTWYGEDLVPSRLQNEKTLEQYDETTSDIAKFIVNSLAKTGVEVSPYKVNYLLDQYGGVVSDYVLPATTLKAENDLNDGTIEGAIASVLMSPLMDRFVSDPVIKNQNVSDFYNIKDEATKNANSSSATDTDIVKNKYLSAISSDANKLYAAKREIQNDPDLTDAEKYKQVREVQKEINALFEKAIDNYNGVDVDGDTYVLDGKIYKKDEDDEWKKQSTKGTACQNIYDLIKGNYKDSDEALLAALNISQTESLKYSDNTTITNSKALQVREQLENEGIYDEVVKAIKNGADPSDYGLSKTVINYTEQGFKNALADAKSASGQKNPKAKTEKETADKRAKDNEAIGTVDYTISDYIATNGVSSSSSSKKKSSSKSSSSSSKKSSTTTEETILDYIRSVVSGQSKMASSDVEKTITSILSKLSSSTTTTQSNLSSIKKKLKNLK